MQISDLYTKIVAYLQDDKNLKDVISNVYDRVPVAAAIPYLHLHLAKTERINTFDKLISKASVVCHGLSYNVQELSRIMEYVAQAFNKYPWQENRCLLVNEGYKIVQLKDVFHSSSNFEVFVYDSL